MSLRKIATNPIEENTEKLGCVDRGKGFFDEQVEVKILNTNEEFIFKELHPADQQSSTVVENTPVQKRKL